MVTREFCQSLSYLEDKLPLESSTLDALSWFLPSLISTSRRARESFSSSLAYYSSSWSSTNLVMVTREFCQSLSYLEDKLPLDSSDCSTQTLWAHAHSLSYSPPSCRQSTVRGLIPLDTGMSMKYQFQLLEHLIWVIVVLRHCEHMLTRWAILLHLVGKVLSEVSYLLTRAWVWNTNFNYWNILYAL